MKLQLNLKFKQKRKDINFFSLQKKKQTVAVAGVLVVLVPVLLLGAMFAVYKYNADQITSLTATYENESRKLAAINLKEKQPILERAQVKRNIYATYYSWVDSLNTQLGNYNIVPSQLLEDMTRIAGSEITCTSIVARNNSLEYNGTAPSYSSIANYQRACSNISGVKDAFVSIIGKSTEIEAVKQAGKFTAVDKNTYSFTMTVEFGDKSEDTQSQE